MSTPETYRTGPLDQNIHVHDYPDLVATHFTDRAFHIDSFVTHADKVLNDQESSKARPNMSKAAKAGLSTRLVDSVTGRPYSYTYRLDQVRVPSATGNRDVDTAQYWPASSRNGRLSVHEPQYRVLGTTIERDATHPSSSDDIETPLPFEDTVQDPDPQSRDYFLAAQKQTPNQGVDSLFICKGLTKEEYDAAWEPQKTARENRPVQTAETSALSAPVGPNKFGSWQQFHSAALEAAVASENPGAETAGSSRNKA